MYYFSRLKRPVIFSLLLIFVCGLAIFGSTQLAGHAAGVSTSARQSGLASANRALKCGVWNVVTSPNAGTLLNRLNAVTAISASDAWAVGSYTTSSNVSQTLTEHWNGTSWSIVPSPNASSANNSLNGLVALSTSDAWAVGSYTTSSNVSQTLTEHWDGTSWSIVPSPNVGLGSNGLNSVAAISTSDIWAVGNYIKSSTVYRTLTEHWNGTTWSVVFSPNPGLNLASSVLNGVATSSTSDVWAVGSSTDPQHGTRVLIEHWNGTNWSIIFNPEALKDAKLSGVMALSAKDVWTVGTYMTSSSIPRTLTEHWNGTSWSVVSSPNPGLASSALNGVAASSTGDVWAVGSSTDAKHGSRALIEHWNGTSWSIFYNPNAPKGGAVLFGALALSAKDILVVGTNATSGTVSQTLIESYC